MSKCLLSTGNNCCYVDQFPLPIHLIFNDLRWTHACRSLWRCFHTSLSILQSCIRNGKLGINYLIAVAFKQIWSTRSRFAFSSSLWHWVVHVSTSGRIATERVEKLKPALSFPIRWCLQIWRISLLFLFYCCKFAFLRHRSICPCYWVDWRVFDFVNNGFWNQFYM